MTFHVKNVIGNLIWMGIRVRRGNDITIDIEKDVYA